MNIFKKILASTTLVLFITSMSVNAKEQYPVDLTFANAVEQSILAVESSAYKNIQVMTNAGVISGEFAQKTNDVLILKEYTGSTHVKTGKEKVALTFIKLDSIVSVSVYILE
jgi:hypothetical protein